MAPIDEALQMALRHHQSGQLVEAAAIYRQILAAEPRHANALYLLGLIESQEGHHETAIEHFLRAVEVNPAQASFHHYLGMAYQSLARRGEARNCFAKALELDPKSAATHYQWALLEHHAEDCAAAEDHYQQAIRLQPDFVEARVNLGDLLHARGKLAEAAAAYEAAARLRPDCAEAISNLGATLVDLDRYEKAVACLEGLVRQRPDSHEAHYHLGRARRGLGLRDEAVECFRTAIRLRADFVPAKTSLGIALQEQGNLPAAADVYREVLQAEPNHAEVLANYGKVLHMLGQPDEALRHYNRALELKPDLDVAHFNRVVFYNERRQWDTALELCHAALELSPNSARLYKNLALSLRQQGEGEESLACYRKSMELEPDSAFNHGDYVYALNFSPDYDAATVFAEHRAWAIQHAEPLTRAARPCQNDPDPRRRLRLGYVSPYFRRHAVNYFTEPIFLAHDHGPFEIYYYSDVGRADATTERIKGVADVWRETRPLNDERLAELVREDRIDILVDLTGHIGGSRLMTFARKPAPVQVTYIGYPNTTGMSAIDYRFTDDWSDPPGQTDRYHTERLIRLPRAFFCYQPHEEAAPPVPLPALSNGYVTFGSFNNYMKVTPEVVSTWLEILSRVPDSRLLVLAYRGGRLERKWHGLAQERGIDPARIELCDACATPEYLRLQQRVDIALDPFPVNGHTTTCDSIWMGVPVVMLAGQVHATRLGGSVLVNVGLEDLIADSVPRYLELAVDLANDLPRLSTLRDTLRDRMAASPILDHAGFTRNLEAAYRQMWIDWCRTSPTSEPGHGNS